jgi:chloride channel protein, CIC family
VAETMDRDVPTIAAALRVGELAERIAKHDPEVSHHQGLFIVSSEGKLQGVTTRGDVLQY